LRLKTANGSLFMNRRHFLTTTAALTATALPATAAGPRKRLGVSIASYGIRWGSKVPSARYPGWSSALEVFDHCHRLGAGCLQIGVGGWESDFAGKVRDKRESLGLALEGQISLPKSEGDVARFEASVRAAKEAGATILRTVCLGGRRYENFDSAESWQRFVEDSWTRLTLAEPVMRRQRVKLAVENHKDWRIDEHVALLKRLGSEWVGVNLDFGNNLSLLDDPLETIEALAPFTFTTHFKDMAVQAHEDGFLLSEVPLGDGFLDLKRMKDICERANPAVQFNLEMITRDPLKVPVLREKYWATFGDLPAHPLARALALVKQHPPKQPLPAVTGKSPEERLAFEEENNARSFTWAREQLGL
jgi:3-oxoisoapionate decarboxylase